MCRWLSLCVVLGLAAPAAAQIVSDREVEITKALFDSGKYQEVVERTRTAMAITNFTEKQRVDLHMYTGLAAFNLGDLEQARRSFLQMLQLNPDAVLDPFAVPPPAIKVFEDVRRDSADALNLIRQQLALRAEQEKRALAERERQRLEEEARRRRLEELSQDITVRTVEKRSMLVNFLPFGVGQFQQGRTNWGIGFASAQTVLALTSIIAYFALESMFEDVTYTWSDRLGTPDGQFSVTLRRIPAARQRDADVWRMLKVVTGVGFYVGWGLGVADAVWHHQGEVVRERKVRPDAPRASLFLSPGGGGLSVRFGF